MFSESIPETSQLIIVAEESFLEWLKRGETVQTFNTFKEEV